MPEIAERPILEQKTQENQNKILFSLGQMRRKFKKSDPAGYAVHMLKEAQYKHPENSQVYMQRVQRFLGKLYKKQLPK